MLEDPTEPAEGGEPATASIRPTYGRTASRGMLWLAANTFAGKGFGFLAQLVLGWIFSADDFGLYATATSASAVLAAVQSGGIPKLLMQRADRFDADAPRLTRFSLGFSCLVGLALAVVAPGLATWYGRDGLLPMLWVIAAAFPFTALAAAPRATLSVQLRFGDLAKLNTISTAIKYGLTIALAVAGVGPLSFVLPTLFTAIFDLWLGRRFGASVPWRAPAGHLDRAASLKILLETRWILFSSLAVALVTQGDYLVLSVTAPTIVGVYFFGFQLSSTISQLFTSGIANVLLPTFSRMGDDIPRQQAAFVASLRISAITIAPASVAAALVFDPVIRIAWVGKWNEAIPVAMLMAASISYRIFGTLARSLVQARAQWRLEAAIVWSDAVGTVCVTAAGSLIGNGGLLQISATIFLYRLFVGLSQVLIASHLASIPWRHVVKECVIPASLPIPLGVLSFWLSQRFMAPSVASGILATVIFLSLATCSALLLHRNELKRFSNQLTGRSSTKRSSDADC